MFISLNDCKIKNSKICVFSKNDITCDGSQGFSSLKKGIDILTNVGFRAL